MYKIILLVASLLALPALAGSVTDIGDTTLNALEQQRKGVGAVETRPMLKDVANRSYERYLQSFTYPIPEAFNREEEFITGN